MKTPIELWNKYVQEELSFEYKHLSNDEFNEQTEDIKNAFEYAIEATKPKWIKIDKEFAKNFIGYAWVNFENPFTGSNDIAFRFMSKRSDFVFATHIMQVEKPSPPKTTDNDNP